MRFERPPTPTSWPLVASVLASLIIMIVRFPCGLVGRPAAETHTHTHTYHHSLVPVCSTPGSSSRINPRGFPHFHDEVTQQVSRVSSADALFSPAIKQSRQKCGYLFSLSLRSFCATISSIGVCPRYGSRGDRGHHRLGHRAACVSLSSHLLMASAASSVAN